MWSDTTGRFGTNGWTSKSLNHRGGAADRHRMAVDYNNGRPNVGIGDATTTMTPKNGRVILTVSTRQNGEDYPLQNKLAPAVYADAEH